MAVIQQPGAVTMGRMIVCPVEGTREWSTGVCDCFTDIKTCIFGYCCITCMLCTVAGRMGESVCMPFCVPGALIAMRARIRTMGGIKGSICKDCLVVGCFPHLAVCQMDRELGAMGL